MYSYRTATGGEYINQVHKDSSFFNLLDIWLGLVDHEFATGTVLLLPQVDHDAAVADCGRKRDCN